MIAVFLPGPLRVYAGGRDSVELAAGPRTVREALDALAALHPGIGQRILTERGEVREHINVFVGAESIKFTGGLSTPVHDGEELSILPAISGG